MDPLVIKWEYNQWQVAAMIFAVNSTCQCLFGQLSLRFNASAKGSQFSFCDVGEYAATNAKQAARNL